MDTINMQINEFPISDLELAAAHINRLEKMDDNLLSQHDIAIYRPLTTATFKQMREDNVELTHEEYSLVEFLIECSKTFDAGQAEASDQERMMMDFDPRPNHLELDGREYREYIEMVGS